MRPTSRFGIYTHGVSGDPYPESREPGNQTPVHVSAPDVGDLEEAFVLSALRSGWVAPAGPDLSAFETELAARCQRQRAVALSSGTAALHLALLELGVGPGSVVLVPTMTFIATANAVLYTGAIPIFIDCEFETGNLDPQVLDEALTDLARRSIAVSAVVTVDLLGKCVDYDSIKTICSSHEVPIIEDAAEAIGAEFAGQPAGSFGVAAVLSFNGNKIMTTSGGGALVTDDPVLADRVRYRSTQARQPVSHYEHTELGFNYRLSNVLAALGRAQLARLDDMIKRRRAIRDHYSELLGDRIGIEIFQRDDDSRDNCWLTALIVNPDEVGWHVSELEAALGKHAIETRRLWKPMHRQPMFEGARSFLTGASDRLFDRGLTLPSGSGLTSDQIERVDLAITDFLRER